MLLRLRFLRGQFLAEKGCERLRASGPHRDFDDRRQRRRERAAPLRLFLLLAVFGVLVGVERAVVPLRYRAVDQHVRDDRDVLVRASPVAVDLPPRRRLRRQVIDEPAELANVEVLFRPCGVEALVEADEVREDDALVRLSETQDAQEFGSDTPRPRMWS